MKTWIYAKRNLKELLSDPLNLIFTIVLPVFLLIFMVSLNKSLQMNPSFDVGNFVPSTIIFSFAFLTMFSGMLIAKDRSSRFLTRLYISPLKSYQYILGYMIPLFLMALIQSVILYSVGFILGLTISVHVFLSIPFLLVIALLFISLGLLLGSFLKDQQVGAIASVLIQLVAFLSGMWFSLDLVGGAFEIIGYVLPFAHAVDMIKLIISGNYSEIWNHLSIVSIYMIIATLIAVFAFKSNMKD